MGKVLGTRYQNPQFQCDNGMVFDLKPITGWAYNRWQIEYNRKHPEPVAPLGTPLENGAPYRDKEHPDYVRALAEWNDTYQEAMLTYVFGKGILGGPPPDWVNEFEIFENNPKLAWVFSNLESHDLSNDATNELNQLMKAIIGLDMVTEGAVQEAQKN